MKYVYDSTTGTEGWENWPETTDAELRELMDRYNIGRAIAADDEAWREPPKRIPTRTVLAFAAAVGLALGGIAALWGLT